MTFAGLAALCLVLSGMCSLCALVALYRQPTCILCGKRRRHADDCPRR